MNNKHQELIAEKVEDLISQGFCFQHEIITETGSYPKTKEALNKTLQDTIDTVLEEERIRLHKLIEKEAEETSAEMLKEVLRQNGLPEGGHALMNTDMMHHIVIGCVGNLSTRLNKGLDKTPPNKV